MKSYIIRVGGPVWLTNNKIGEERKLVFTDVDIVFL
jgi:hypothetical protein